MVTGKEMVFDDIDKAFEYILSKEQNDLKTNAFRQNPPMFLRGMHNPFIEPFKLERAYIPVGSLEYPLNAFYNNAPDDKFIMTRLGSGRYSLKPNLCRRAFLFRGESEFHQPCVPNLSRNPKQKRFTADLARGQEMMLLMLSHPLVQLLDMGVELDGTVCQFEMNLYGLTQHYYNKTQFLDLTSSPEVAAFFATTNYDWRTDTYSPIVDEDHKPGVLYYYGLDVNKDFSMTGLRTIGLQVFPRSRFQRGFLYHLPIGKNFNDLSQLNAVFFHHNAAIAKRISNSFHQGVDLFPNDILTEHWKSYNLGSMVLSNRTVRLNKHFNPDMTMAAVEAEISSFGFHIEDYIPSFTQDELDVYYDSIQNHDFWGNFCSQIHIPGDKDGKMMKDLENLPNNPQYRWAFVRGGSHLLDYSKGYVMNMYKDCLV